MMKMPPRSLDSRPALPVRPGLPSTPTTVRAPQQADIEAGRVLSQRHGLSPLGPFRSATNFVFAAESREGPVVVRITREAISRSELRAQAEFAPNVNLQPAPIFDGSPVTSEGDPLAVAYRRVDVTRYADAKTIGRFLSEHLHTREALARFQAARSRQGLDATNLPSVPGRNEQRLLSAEHSTSPAIQRVASVVRKHFDQVHALAFASTAADDLVLTHGDVHPTNFPIDASGNVVAVDLDNLAAGPATRDAAVLAYRLGGDHGWPSEGEYREFLAGAALPDVRDTAPWKAGRHSQKLGALLYPLATKLVPAQTEEQKTEAIEWVTRELDALDRSAEDAGIEPLGSKEVRRLMREVAVDLGVPNVEVSRLLDTGRGIAG